MKRWELGHWLLFFVTALVLAPLSVALWRWALR